MKPYFDRYPGNEKKALLLYRQNVQLAEALLPSLSIYEVALRNSLIRELENMTGRKDWYDYFSTIPSLKALDIHVNAAKQHILKRQEEVTPDKINGELTMGFWVLLFDAKYERNLRNRVFHNEAISWSLTRLEVLHESIMGVCSWINPALPAWIKTVERFDRVILSARLLHYQYRPGYSLEV